MLVLLPLLCCCYYCLRRCLPHSQRLSPCQLNNGKDACKSTAQGKQNKGKEVCVRRILMPVYQGQQQQHGKDINTSAMAQRHQLDGGNNCGATMLTAPMQCEGKEVRVMIIA
jgi:hypothetical protein